MISSQKNGQSALLSVPFLAKPLPKGGNFVSTKPFAPYSELLGHIFYFCSCIILIPSSFPHPPFFPLFFYFLIAFEQLCPHWLAFVSLSIRVPVYAGHDTYEDNPASIHAVVFVSMTSFLFR